MVKGDHKCFSNKFNFILFFWWNFHYLPLFCCRKTSIKITLTNRRKWYCPETTLEHFAGPLVEINAHRSSIVYWWIIAIRREHIACRRTADCVWPRNTYSKKCLRNRQKKKNAWPDIVGSIKNINECWWLIQNNNSTYTSNRGHRIQQTSLVQSTVIRFARGTFSHPKALLSLYLCNRKWLRDKVWW